MAIISSIGQPNSRRDHGSLRPRLIAPSTTTGAVLAVPQGGCDAIIDLGMPHRFLLASIRAANSGSAPTGAATDDFLRIRS
jgi:hypothetical protein